MDNSITTSLSIKRLLLFGLFAMLPISYGCKNNPVGPGTQSLEPKIDSLSPQVSSPGKVIRIFGKNMAPKDSMSMVRVGNTNALVIHLTDSLYWVRIPDSLVADLYDVSITLGTHSVTCPIKLTVENLPASSPKLDWWTFSKGYVGSFFSIGISNFAEYAQTARVFFGNIEAPVEKEVNGNTVTLRMHIPVTASSGPFIVYYGQNKQLISDSSIELLTLPKLISTEFNPCRQSITFTFDNALISPSHQMLYYGDSLFGYSTQSRAYGNKLDFSFQYSFYEDRENIHWFGDKELILKMDLVYSPVVYQTGFHPTPPITEQLSSAIAVKGLPVIFTDSSDKQFTKSWGFKSLDGGCEQAPNFFTDDSVAVCFDRTRMGGCSVCIGIHNERYLISGIMDKSSSTFSQLMISIDSGDYWENGGAGFGDFTRHNLFAITFKDIPFVRNSEGSIMINVGGATLRNFISAVSYMNGNVSDTKGGYTKTGEYLARLGDDWANASLEITIMKE